MKPIKSSKVKTHVAIILDKSGSMASTKSAAIQGYNEQVQQLKENAKNGQEILVSLVTFNGNVFEHMWEVSADKLQEANADSYQPLGATAMRDAVGFTVQKLLDTTNAEEENTAYLVVVISDGETNSDNYFKVKTINESGKVIEVNPLRELVEKCQKTGKWTFTYMGCSESYLKIISEETAIPIANMAAWSNATKGHTLGAMKSAIKRSATYFDDRSKGVTSKLNFYEESGVACADFSACVDDTDNLPINTGGSGPDLGKPKPIPSAICAKEGSLEVFANSSRVDWNKYSPK